MGLTLIMKWLEKKILQSQGKDWEFILKKTQEGRRRRRLKETFGVDVILKGHCHAIWQLYKKLEGVFALIEFQN